MTQRALLALLVGAVLTPAVAAETYTVRLVSGASFQVSYPLEESPWDKDTLLYLSEGGNWTAIARSEVVEVRSETEFKGQGQIIDATTIFMGLAANDMPLPGDEREASSTERLLQVLQSLGKAPVNTSEQFVEPGEAGGGGIPVELTQPYSPQGGISPQPSLPPIIPLGGEPSGAAGEGGNAAPVLNEPPSQ